MSWLRYDKISRRWRKRTKDEVIDECVDIENKRPCSKCWKLARDYGIYAFPLYPEALAKRKRCKYCDRIL